ncbi:MAG TPA: glycosyltransferase [Bacillota bacterium]|nr:glycosyltransferase [Bacillota bacterium]
MHPGHGRSSVPYSPFKEVNQLSTVIISNSQRTSKKVIVCISSTHWHFLWQRPQQIMSRLSNFYNILFVDPPAQVSEDDLKKPNSQQLHNLAHRITGIHQSLKILAPFHCAGGSEPYQLMIADQIKRTLTFLGWHDPPLLWIYNLAAVPLVGHLRELGVVYDCVDSFASFSWAHPDTHLWEKELLCKAQVVFTSARTLYEKHRELNCLTYFIPNAADYGHFAKADHIGVNEPPDMKSIVRPRIGFVGAAYEWLDYELLSYLAVNHREWRLVMIGPQQHGIELPEEPNIHWMGPRDYKVLPWYLASMDLMLIPFVRNQTTEHANPIKLWEYLAAGKAVVSTALPEVPRVPGVIWVGRDHAEFEDQCQQALDWINSSDKRQELVMKARAIARVNSWEVRCQQIREILRERFRI